MGGVIGTLDPPDALILGDHHGGHAWPDAPVQRGVRAPRCS
jgi:hypothetical protein